MNEYTKHLKNAFLTYCRSNRDLNEVRKVLEETPWHLRKELVSDFRELARLAEENVRACDHPESERMKYSSDHEKCQKCGGWRLLKEKDQDSMWGGVSWSEWNY